MLLRWLLCHQALQADFFRGIPVREGVYIFKAQDAKREKQFQQFVVAVAAVLVDEDAAGGEGPPDAFGVAGGQRPNVGHRDQVPLRDAKVELDRSEERRVRKEWRPRASPDPYK